jgi:hypothetical protein
MRIDEVHLRERSVLMVRAAKLKRMLMWIGFLTVAVGAGSSRAAVIPCVRPALSGEFPPPHYAHDYPVFTDHPDTPDQSIITLTDTDSLALIVLDFDSPAAGGHRGFNILQSGRLGRAEGIQANFRRTKGKV